MMYRLALVITLALGVLLGYGVLWAADAGRSWRDRAARAEAELAACYRLQAELHNTLALERQEYQRRGYPRPYSLMPWTPWP